LKTIFIFLIMCLLVVKVLASSVELTQSEKNWIKNHPILILGTDSSWAPFVIKKNGYLFGYDQDILQLINENTGANFQLTTGAWKDMLEKAMSKEIDGLSTSAIHEERSKDFNFSDVYTSTKKFWIILDNNPKNINSIDDLDGKRIGYQEQNLFDKKLVSQYKNYTLVPFNSLEEVLQSLVKGEIDATIGNHEAFYLAEKNRLPYIKILADVPNSKLDLVFSLRKDYPEALSIINKGLASIPENIKNNLDKKWFNVIQHSIKATENLNLNNEEKNYLRNKKVLTVANLDDLPPFNFYENGQAKGYTVDYMKLLESYLDIKIEFISNKSWNEYLMMLKEKKIDLIPHVAITKEREEYLAFTNFNHIEYTTGVAVSKNSTIKSMKDLENKIIAVTNNSFLHKYLKTQYPEYKLLLRPSTADGVESLSLGESNAVIGSLPTLDYYIQKNWLSNVKTITIDDLGISLKTNLPMAVHKDNQILKSILEKVNLAIPHNKIVELRQKWMNIAPLSNTNNKMSMAQNEYLKTKDKIKMCVLPNWLPFEQIDNKGNHKGIGADFMEIISKYIDKQIVLVPTTQWSESLQNIRDRKCDILPVAMDVPSRRDAMNFTKPYVLEPFVIATKLDELFIKDSSSLNHKKVGIVKSYAFIEVLKIKNPTIEIVSVANTKEGLERVESGELFGYIDTMPTVGYGIQKYSMFNLKIAGKLEFDIELSIASRNDEPILNTIMQDALDSISEEQRRTIIGKWIEIKVAQVFDYTILWQVSALFLFIVLAVLYKNRAVILLNRELVKVKNEIEEQQKMVDKYVLILSTNINGIIIDVNEAFCRVTGHTKEELIGFKHNLIKHPDMKDSFFDELWQTLGENKKWSGEIKNLRKDKTSIFFNVYIEPIFKNDIKIGYRSISEDITDKKRIEELSITDKLTGLYNRFKLDELMTIKIEEFRRYEVNFSILLIDIDNFKEVNDTYGHDVGDYILQIIGKTLKENIRITDIIGRWGGEEFIIICNNTNLDNAKNLAENIRKIIQNIKFDKVGTKTISIGLAQFQEEDDVKTIFKKADNALYEAKTTGKNKVCTI
jgi:diguanylate cyclase (GGDEF)-like protein/PAS domain S-box-containing protein